jgi:Ca2+-binding RTX toxin-like protein
LLDSVITDPYRRGGIEAAAAPNTLLPFARQVIVMVPLILLPAMTPATSIVASPRPSSAAGIECTIRGTAGDDSLVGTVGKDVICGFQGNDFVRWSPGDDLILGGPGRDSLNGGTGRDRVFGGPGRWKDFLSGDEGTDVLRGGRGPDEMAGGSGDDRAFGGRGFDEIRVGTVPGVDYMAGGPGDDRCLDSLDLSNNDLIKGGRGTDTYLADEGDRVVSAEIEGPTEGCD